jgi:hypothetical protein
VDSPYLWIKKERIKMALFEEDWEKKILRTVKVFFTDSNGQENHGSGMFIKKNNIIFFVTANHVLFSEEGHLKPSDEITLIGYNDLINHEQFEYRFRFKTVYETSMFKSSNSHDVCVLLIGFWDNTNGLKFVNRIESLGNPNLVVTDLSEGVEITPKPGHEIFVIGYPSIGEEVNSVMEKTRPIISKGIISSIYRDKKIIIGQSHMQPGGSGGTVYSKEIHIDGNIQLRSNVIGIASTRLLRNERTMLENVSDSDFDMANFNVHSGFISIIPIEVVKETVDDFIDELKTNITYVTHIALTLKIN